MKERMRLIIMRHGETVENVKGIMQGQLPGKLTKKGIGQAKRLAKRLKDEEIDYIYSSDLARATDTTKEIVKFHPKTTVEYVKDLRERNLGEFQGIKKSDIGWDKSKSVTYPQPKKGETIDELYDRAKKFLYKVLRKHKDDRILIVAHHGINSAIICVIKKKRPEDIQKVETFKNSSITIFEIDEEKNYKIKVWDCAKHLNEKKI